MSSCVVIQNKNNLIFAADTALSAYVDGNFYRVNSEYHKIHSYDDGWYFFCGRESVFSLVNQRIKGYGFDDIELWLKHIIGINPGCLYDAEIIRMDKNTNIVYQYSQYNDFECVIHYPPDSGFNIITSGYKTKELFYLISSGMKVSLDIFNIIVDSYQRIADACVGGSIDLNINGDVQNIKIPENICINQNCIGQYLIATDFVESGHIHGSSIVGSRIGIGTYGSDNHYDFEVNSNGHVIAKKGEFKGELVSASIETSKISNKNSTFSISDNGFLFCTNAKIGNWTFSEGKIYSNNLTLNSDGSIDGITWRVDKDGNAFFNSCNLSISTTKTKVDNYTQQIGSYLNTIVSNNVYVKDKLTTTELNAGLIETNDLAFDSISVENMLTTTDGYAKLTQVFDTLSVDYLDANVEIDANYIKAGTITSKWLNIKQTDYETDAKNAIETRWNQMNRIDVNTLNISGIAGYILQYVPNPAFGNKKSSRIFIKSN